MVVIEEMDVKLLLIVMLEVEMDWHMFLVLGEDGDNYDT